VDAWPERFPGNDQVPPYSLDLLALAEKDGGEGWLAVDVRLGEREVTSAMVADFVRRCRLFQNRASLSAGTIKGWIISGGGFSAEAVEALRKLRFWSGGPEQLRLMAAMTGWGGTMKFILPEDEGPEEPRVFELVIPAADDTELVAARALEQVGQGLPLAEGEIGKVKMALVEACINAFEHGGSEEKKVYITFRVGRSSLEMEVFNRGRSFVPGTIVKPAIEDKMASVRKRGWGLSLIKELMDDMEFVQREDGTLLRMVKYFKGKPGEGRHA
jgi:serine/threonine-protein kinase RsbW